MSQRLTFVTLSVERVHRCFCDYLFVNFHTGKLLQLVGEAGALEHGHVSQSLDLSEAQVLESVDQLVDGQRVLLVGLGERVGQLLLQELEQQQCEEADEEVGADAVLPGEVDGPGLEVGLGGAEQVLYLVMEGACLEHERGLVVERGGVGVEAVELLLLPEDVVIDDHLGLDGRLSVVGLVYGLYVVERRLLRAARVGLPPGHYLPGRREALGALVPEEEGEVVAVGDDDPLGPGGALPLPDAPPPGVDGRCAGVLPAGLEPLRVEAFHGFVDKYLLVECGLAQQGAVSLAALAQHVQVVEAAVGVLLAQQPGLFPVGAVAQPPAPGVDGGPAVGGGQRGDRLDADVVAALVHVVAPVALRGQAGVGGDDELGQAELAPQHILERLERGLLRLVAREDHEGQRDAVHVHEHAHLHDGAGPVLLRLAALAQPGHELAGLYVHRVPVVVLDLEVVVGAVVVDHPVPAFHEPGRAGVDAGLDVVDVAREQAQGPVHVGLAELRGPNQPLRFPQRPLLGAGEEQTARDQRPQYPVEVELRLARLLDLGAHAGQAEPVVERQQHQVAARPQRQVALAHGLARVEVNRNALPAGLLLLGHAGRQVPDPLARVLAAVLAPDVLKQPQPPDSLGGRLAVDAHRLLDVSPRALLCSAECRLHIDNPLK